jgi:arylsulfatase A-like enzyme
MKSLAMFSSFATIFTVSFFFADNVQLPVVALTAPPGPQTDNSSKPNFVFIMSDDQDYEMDSLNYMPLLKKYIADEGTRFERHYATTAQCCPSRTSLWTGKATHNTNVTDVRPPYGTHGFPYQLIFRLELVSRCLGEIRRAKS